MNGPGSATAPELPEAGSLADTPLPRLLLALYARRFDGCLVLESGRQEKRFDFAGGAPVFVESNVASDSLAALLVERGTIAAADRDRIHECVQKKRCREGVAILSLQLLGPKELLLALKDQIRRRLVDCFAWPDGRFRIEGGGAPAEDTQALRCDPLLLTREGLETHWRIERMLDDLAGALERYPVPTRRLPKLLRRLGLDAEPAARLATLDGRATLAAALGPLFGTPRVVAAVWVLDAAGAFAHQDAPAGDAADGLMGFESEIEIAVDEAARAEAAGPSAPPKTAGKPAGGAADRAAKSAAEGAAQDGKQADGAALRAQIEKLRASLGEMDHYALLGVERDARAGAIKKAYIKAAKQYHPDTLSRLGLADLREDASEVFARIGEAFEVLSDAARRADYDAELRGELTEKDARRLAQAESSYRKGEILLRMGDFAGALEYLQPAVEIWPDEPVYQSALGWALFKQPKSDLEQARGHLEQAVRLGPEDATAHMRLGMVLRALGETAEAEKITAIARRLNPDGH